jgi:DNA-binding NtrC family response regulator
MYREMRGPALATKLKTPLPQIRVVYMTGYLDQNGVEEDFLKDAFFLQKPFSRESLVGKVGEALKKGKSIKLLAQTTPV